jgi:predicted branched-subunit amino acid permease
LIGLVTRSALLEQPKGQWVALEEDRLLATILICRGLPVRVVAWDDASVDWSAFKLLVLRSTWDAGMPRSLSYLAWLRQVETSATVCNPRSVLEWREQTDALTQLAAHGVPLAVLSSARPVAAEWNTHSVVLLREQTTQKWLVANAWCKGETLLVPTEEEVALAHQTLRALYRRLGPVMNACLVMRVDLLQDEAGDWWVQDVDLQPSRLLLHQRRQAAWCLVEAIEARYRCTSPARGVGQEAQAPLCDELVAPPQVHPLERARAQVASKGAEWRQGVLAGLPLALSLIPLMGVFSVLARTAGLSAVEAQVMSLLVFSGAQLVAAQMLLVGSPVAFIVGIGGILNARHLLYSATLAPYVKGLPWWWRCLLGYLLTDEAFAAGSAHYQRPGSPEQRHWFLFGAGLAVWLAAQGGTLLGSLLGAYLPPAWSLDFTAPLSFIALAVLLLKDRACLAAAIVAGALALVTAALPLNLGLLVAALVGILAGVGVESFTTARLKRRETQIDRYLGAHWGVGDDHLSAPRLRLPALAPRRALLPAPAGAPLAASRDADRAHRAVSRAQWSAANASHYPPPDRGEHRSAGGMENSPRPGDGGGGDERALVTSVARSWTTLKGGTSDGTLL